MYTAHVLTFKSQDELVRRFPPKYSKFVGHHVTVQFGVPKDTPPPEPADVVVHAYADTEDGLEALIVTVNGTWDRPDGSKYHITWSLDPTRYKPVDSNKLVSGNRYTPIDPFPIKTTPATL